jgi:hypothetical protein
LDEDRTRRRYVGKYAECECIKRGNNIWRGARKQQTGRRLSSEKCKGCSRAGRGRCNILACSSVLAIPASFVSNRIRVSDHPDWSGNAKTWGTMTLLSNLQHHEQPVENRQVNNPTASSGSLDDKFSSPTNDFRNRAWISDLRANIIWNSCTTSHSAIRHTAQSTPSTTPILGPANSCPYVQG